MMYTPKYLSYSTKVWLTSVLLSPLLLLLSMIPFHPARLLEYFFTTLFIIGFSIVCSVPNWLILMACTWKINAQKWTFWQKKIILSVLCMVFTILLFMLVFHDDFVRGEDIWNLAFIYVGTLVFGIWIYDLQPSFSESIENTEIEYDSNRMFLEDLPEE